MSAAGSSSSADAGIDWAELIRVGAFDLQQSDVELFKRPVIDLLRMGNKPARSLAASLLKLLRNVTDEKLLLFGLHRMAELLAAGDAPPAPGMVGSWGGTLADMRDRGAVFVPSGEAAIGQRDVETLLRLTKQDQPPKVARGAMIVLASLLGAFPRERDVRVFVGNLLRRLREAGNQTGSVSDDVAMASGALMLLLRCEEGRRELLAAGGVHTLVHAIQVTGGSDQLVYELLFCLWCVTFCGDRGEAGDVSASKAQTDALDSLRRAFDTEAVSAVAAQVAAARREKLVRVAIAALRNLARASTYFAEPMVACGLLQTLDNFRERKWIDEDVVADLGAVREYLLRNFRELSSMERYEQEVFGGQLEWGHLHSEKFWREHAAACDREDFKVIRKLMLHLGSPNATVQAIACSDLGEFARFYPNGRSVVKHLNVKPVVLGLMDSEEPEVQRHALLAVSKMMVNNWEFVR